MNKIVFTGGGSAGHVTPNMALISRLKEDGWQIEYIGSNDGIEKGLIEGIGILYHGISSGKLRRYFSLQNFLDPLKVIWGIVQAFFILRKIKPGIVFSKGGFVTVPVIIGSYLNSIPVIIHESDFTPGLANKISIPLAKKVCVSFPETLKYLPQEKGVYTGTPIREELLTGDSSKGLNFCGFDDGKPVLMVIGGSLGSESVNRAVRSIIDKLLEKFQVVHICGKGNISKEFENKSGYRQFEYISQELPDLFAMTDIVVSRAGSNAIFEFLAMKKPHLLIPLPLSASRGDQILNAQSFEKSGFSKILPEEDITPDKLYNEITELFDNKEQYISKMNESTGNDNVETITELLKKYIHTDERAEVTQV